MGERIKNLSSFTLKGQKVTIELNKRDSADMEYDIHMEAPCIRCNMTDHEFMRIAACVAEAGRKLEYKRKGRK